MIDITAKARLFRLALLISAGTLAGCHLTNVTHAPTDPVTSHTFDRANWMQLQAAPQTQVEEVSLVHSVRFAESGAELTADERAKLIAFLRENGVHDGMRLELDGPRRGGGYHDPLTSARLAALGTELASLGLRSDVPRLPNTLIGRTDNEITLTLSRAVAVVPDCLAPQPAFALKPDYKIGCSNNANLGLMVANPLDLQRGRTMGPLDSEAMTLSVQKYRQDKTDDLIREDTR
jgi:pilus assembly protein CpaD